MRHQVKKNRISRAKGPRKLLVGNLATSLVLHGKIKTTKAKAKAVQPVIERLIIAAKGSNKRLAIQEVSKVLQNKKSSMMLFDEIVKKYQDRATGFTRISDLGFRAGDRAPLVQIELV
jgi:large subunit ribosomal protein L17